MVRAGMDGWMDGCVCVCEPVCVRALVGLICRMDLRRGALRMHMRTWAISVSGSATKC